MYKTITVTPAVAEPVTFSEALNQLRVESGFDDDHIASLISIARDKAERYCNRFFTEQVLKIVYTEPLSGVINIPYPDVASVDEITYLDSNNQIQTIPSADYFFNSDYQQVFPVSSFPYGVSRYSVTVTTGAPAEMGAVKIAILMLLTDLYELRTESVTGVSVASNPAVVASLYPYRVNIGV